MAARGNAGYRKRGDSAVASQDAVKPAVGRRKLNKKSRPALHAKKVVGGIRNSMSGAACCQRAGDARKRTPNLKVVLHEESSSGGPQTNENHSKGCSTRRDCGMDGLEQWGRHQQGSGGGREKYNGRKS
ncbi:hypothetical protein C8J57DRAFT_1242545 [Mycena rebaudengoi]|jgi:hypothetical protein|nr:hypothetical protein C8J57DRAFT_1242545 [Mycena rebaudengoi]